MTIGVIGIDVTTAQPLTKRAQAMALEEAYQEDREHECTLGVSFTRGSIIAIKHMEKGEDCPAGLAYEMTTFFTVIYGSTGFANSFHVAVVYLAKWLIHL